VIILVSINLDAGTVALWHVPRDLFVFVPDYAMDRINLAYAIGEKNDDPRGGFGVLQATFLYNFGIQVDHYAAVNFDDFQAIVRRLGGLQISIDCGLQDWRLKDPALDPGLEDSWELYTLPIGRRTLDPTMALWYVRSRVTTSDLDRGRRQMDVLRAMWHQAQQQGLFSQVTDLWPRALEVVDTDMTLENVLAFVPLALSLDAGQIARYSGAIDVHYRRFFTPDNGRDVLLPERDALLTLIEDLLTPPTENRLQRQRVRVEIADSSGYYAGFHLVAADRLAWEGFDAVPLDEPGEVRRELSTITDYTGQTKGSPVKELQRLLRVEDAQVISQPDPNRTVDFRVEIGFAYNSCVYGSAEDEIAEGPPLGE
jgi:LCP family protein required for cell wall assembly